MALISDALHSQLETLVLHDPVRDQLYLMAINAGRDVSKESKVPGTAKQIRLDIKLRGGREAHYLDIRSCSSLSSNETELATSAAVPGAGAIRGENIKDRHYAAHLPPRSLTPMCFEDGGRWGNLALEFIRDDIVNRAPGNSAEKMGFHVYWRRRLAVTVAPGGRSDRYRLSL